MMMAVILTDTGMIKETIIKFDEDITAKQVENMPIAEIRPMLAGEVSQAEEAAKLVA